MHKYNYNKHRENIGWLPKQIFNLYKKENPEWDDDECWEKADLIYKELNRINIKSYRNEQRFWKHNTPFSFNPLLEDGKFEEFRKTQQYKDDYNKWIDDKATKMLIKQLKNGEFENFDD